MEKQGAVKCSYHCLAAHLFFSSENKTLYRGLPQSYDYHCTLLSGPLADQDSTTYGINNRSPLNDLKHFHAANFQLPQDIMHIVLEGVVPYE